MTPLRQRFLEDMQLRHLAPSSQSTYLFRVIDFARHFGRSPADLGLEEVRRYLLFLTQEKKVSRSYFKQARSALSFLYRFTLNRPEIPPRIPYPRSDRKLPEVLSPDEVIRFFERHQEPQASHDADNALRDRRACSRSFTTADWRTTLPPSKTIARLPNPSAGQPNATRPNVTPRVANPDDGQRGRPADSDFGGPIGRSRTLETESAGRRFSPILLAHVSSESRLDDE